MIWILSITLILFTLQIYCSWITFCNYENNNISDYPALHHEKLLFGFCLIFCVPVWIPFLTPLLLVWLFGKEYFTFRPVSWTMAIAIWGAASVLAVLVILPELLKVENCSSEVVETCYPGIVHKLKYANQAIGQKLNFGKAFNYCWKAFQVLYLIYSTVRYFSFLRKWKKDNQLIASE